MQQCDYKSKTEVEMHQHKVRIHESKQSSEIFNCDFCYYRTSTSYELNIHEHKTQRTNTIKCNQCDFTAKNEEILKKHHTVAKGHKRKIT